MNQALIEKSIEVEARLRTGSCAPRGFDEVNDVRDEGAETLAAMRTAMESASGGLFTADEQSILATHVDSIRMLALWNHIQSGRIDSTEEAAYYEDRSCHFYDMARNLMSRKKKSA